MKHLLKYIFIVTYKTFSGGTFEQVGGGQWVYRGAYLSVLHFSTHQNVDVLRGIVTSLVQGNQLSEEI